MPEDVVAFEQAGTTVEASHTLHPQTLLAMPDMTPGSEWLSVVSDMRYDGVSGTFFVMDKRAGTVAEVDTLGTLVRIYGGGSGRGPQEVRDLVDYSLSPTSVAFLDRGNTKVLIYLRLGRRARQFSVSPAYRSIALAADETILVVPGTGLYAVDVYEASGDLVGGVGAFEELPVRCVPEEDCDRTRSMCLGCVVRVVGDAVLVMNTEQDLLTVFGGNGRPSRSLDLRKRIPQLAEWIAADEPHLARMQEDADARSNGSVIRVVSRNYFRNVHASPDGRLALSVNPALPILQASGYQYWLLDIHTLEIETAMFSDLGHGMIATGWPTVFGVQRRSYAIYRLQD